MIRLNRFPHSLFLVSLMRRSSWLARLSIGVCVGLVSGLLGGCSDDSEALREIQLRRQQQLQSTTTIDHLPEARKLIGQLGQSEITAAAGQITYHLNAWAASQTPPELAVPGELLATWQAVLPPQEALSQLNKPEFQNADVQHFRLQYLLHRISNWTLDAPVLDAWTQQRIESEGLPDADQYRLQVAGRLFDWVVRNTQLEPLQWTNPAPSVTGLPAGLEFRGPGYRQTSWETLWRGSGDPLQRSDLFLQLCRHAGIDACLLGLPQQNGEPQPWMLGVLIGEQMFLFEPGLGLAVPGPDEAGVATLQEAREDPSVLRRLKVPGVFDYPYASSDVQQSVALLNATPELLSLRMRWLSESLTGEDRMNLYLDAESLAERLDGVPGIAGVRLWHVPLQARVYQQAIAEAMRDNIQLSQWYFAQWATFAEQSALGQARWKHLQGQFESDAQQSIEGARVLYMQLRRPEFELADLDMDLSLQDQYDLRRQPGEQQQDYDRRILFMQEMIRAVKRNATFWLALIHFEEADWDAAEKWLAERVLQDPQASRWHSAARYNLARTYERLGEWQKAEELYKTSGDFQEQGNRIRARLVIPENEDS